MKPLLVRWMVSATVGTFVFVSAVAFHFMLLGDIIPLQPPEHRMQDGIERIPWQIILPTSLGLAAMTTVAAWLFIKRRQTRALP
jgi:hypothetical protein